MTDKVDRNPRIVVLCEDARHGKCVRAFLRERGIHKGAIRVRTCPAATQDAKQWIRETSLPEEWAFLDKYNVANE